MRFLEASLNKLGWRKVHLQEDDELREHLSRHVIPVEKRKGGVGRFPFTPHPDGSAYNIQQDLLCHAFVHTSGLTISSTPGLDASRKRFAVTCR